VPPPVIELGVPHQRRVASPRGSRVVRLRRFEAVLDEVAYPWRTTPAAAVLDCAADEAADEALALLARAVQRRTAAAASVRHELAVRGRHPHGALLAEVLTTVEDGAHSAAEVRYVRDVERAHGLPRGHRQVAGHRGAVHDVGYSEFATIVEIDGRLGHETWSDRVRDGRRDRGAAAGGMFTLRLFWTDVAVLPCRTAAEVGAVLRARGWLGRPRPCRRGECVIDPG